MHSGFKTEAKVADYGKKLTKLSFQLKAEMEFLAGRRLFERAT